MASIVRSFINSTVEFGKLACYEMLPYGLDVASSLLPVRSIACFAAGGALFYKAGLVDMIRNKWTKRVRRSQSLPLTPAKKVMVLAGIGFLGVGLYSLVSHTQRVWLASPIALQPATRDSAKEVLDTLRQCPKADTLWKTLQEGGKISLKIESGGAFIEGGKWNQVTRTISLAPSLPLHEKVTYALFEMCNAERSPTFLQIHAESQSGLLNFEQYLKKIVSIEWNSMQCHHKIAQSCVESSKWPRESDQYRRVLTLFRSFEAFWKEYLKEPYYDRTRASYFGKWSTYYKVPYCQKNPLALDCMRSAT